ncbi:hypothetical protein [Nocardioides litoris]|uniref:hypothetical protein n=1 Tax=Nocardioides litoris TaxID=1926648 RepID=UPI00111DE53B|nr:hypothetical protein [Nocardioides litoris]
MSTKYDVSVTAAIVDRDGFHATCSCDCGWQGTAYGDREPLALAEAARERLDHLLQAHPRQSPSARLRPRAAARYRHPRSVSAATAHGRRWSRYVGCACGWTATVRSGSAAAAARSARAKHRAHVTLQTGRAPWQDYLVLLAVLLVVAVVLTIGAVVVVTAAGEDPRDLTDLSELRAWWSDL